MREQNYGVIRAGAGHAVLKATPFPKLRDNYTLVRTVAVALNPTDWTTLEAKGDVGTLVGCDYAGIVVEVGEAVVKSFKQGDRVAGFGHGANDANPETGAFARFIAVQGDLQMHIPDHVSFESAATAAVGVCTTGYALYKVLGLPWPIPTPSTTNEPFLIYGGSTSTGSIAIQIAKLSRYKVFTTCSPQHFDVVKGRGADMVYDYVSVMPTTQIPNTDDVQHEPNIGTQIRKDTGNALNKVLDTVSVESTAAICALAFGDKGGLYCNLLGAECIRSDVKSEFFLGYSMSGEEYIFEGDTYPAQSEDRKFGLRWMEVAEKLWAEGKWKCHPELVNGGGLLGAIEGMRAMKNGSRPSGVKWVYRVDETEWPL
ncbi:hypothetical protein LTR62_005662 [Meristemomyces frigidus]|uniref:Enoyl reductase (ER) domain-containing protein n=1 Tax=Meristemomyces frigidus TaxID=1508187 RepID=A0AAN7TDB0_9PEZI|nr:hypothetical protein LTR62_005662 [Meristemomyces frigidus]